MERAELLNSKHTPRSVKYLKERFDLLVMIGTGPRKGIVLR